MEGGWNELTVDAEVYAVGSRVVKSNKRALRQVIDTIIFFPPEASTPRSLETRLYSPCRVSHLSHHPQLGAQGGSIQDWFRFSVAEIEIDVGRSRRSQGDVVA